MNMKHVIGLVIIASALLVCGCPGPDLSHLPPTVDAEGMITLDGNPVEGASIVFIDSMGETFARGISDSKGRFSLDVFEEKPGAIPGEYKVQASKTVETADGQSWENELPMQYGSITTSGWTVMIPEDGISDIKLEMVSK